MKFSEISNHGLGTLDEDASVYAKTFVTKTETFRHDYSKPFTYTFKHADIESSLIGKIIDESFSDGAKDPIFPSNEGPDFTNPSHCFTNLVDSKRWWHDRQLVCVIHGEPDLELSPALDIFL